MNKYQIKEIKESLNHAGTKAVDDICIFAEQKGYTPITINTRIDKDIKFAKIINQFGYLCDWIKLFISVKKRSIVLQQNPYRKRNLGREWCLRALKKIKKCKLISIVHDVEEIREIEFNNYYKKEFNFMMTIADCIVIHNNKMKDYFINKGYPENKIIELGIFDYYTEVNIKRDKKFKREITVAGNLHERKSAYVYELNKLDTTFKINLFGPNFNCKATSSKKIKYHGSFKAEEVPGKLTGSFGLVWDGTDLNTCSGSTGNYLKFNNPHKISLYLASELPVIVWKESAMQSLVEKEKVGYCVGSLDEIEGIINDITEREYCEILQNTSRLSKKLRDGQHTKTALIKAENLVIDK